MQVRVRLAGVEGRGFGSGYLLAPRLVLTAAHVLDGMAPPGPDTVTVSRPDAGEREFPATVVWRRKDALVDAALVEVVDTDPEHPWPVPESLGDPIARPPQRFGHLIGTRPHPVTLLGFPRMQKDPDDGDRLDEQVTGRIPPGTGSLAHRHEILSNDPLPDIRPAPSDDPLAGPRAAAGSPWSGISGSAVLTDDGPDGDFLLGVVRYDHHGVGGTRLTATRATHLIADEAFRDLVERHTGWEPVLEPVEPARVLAPAAPGRDLASPAALLRADAEAVTFHGRDTELADLYAWCTTGSPALAARVLTGPGGQGKTRLARRLADILAREGWATGHLRSELTDHDRRSPDLTTLATALPLLVVVDYAETRPRLLRDLITTLHPSRHRLRLLLLARSDGDWRTFGDADPAVGNLLGAAPIAELAPLGPHRAQATRQGTTDPDATRAAAFHSAARDLARLLPRVPTLPDHDWATLAAGLRPPDDLEHPRHDNALTLQMAALVALLQHGPAPADTAPGDSLEKVLLRHEHRFWKDTAKASAFELGHLPIPTLGAAVATAALCGADRRADATAVLGTLPDLPTHNVNGTADWVKKLYPAEPDRYWGSLQPDRIAEYHASQTLTDENLTLTDLLPAATPGQQARLITVLARAAIAHHNAGRTRDRARLLDILATDLDTTTLTHTVLWTATAALPYPAPVIAPLALRLTEALTRAERRRAHEDPAAHEPDLARSLSNLGIRLSEVGRRGEALTAEQQAVGIRRRLAAENPAAHEPDLARSLSNLGVWLSDVGRRGEALTAAEQSVEIRRRLAAGNPAAHEPDLAASLSGLGVRLSEAGRRAEALTAEQQAVGIRRRLAAENPAAHEPDLAASLTNLGNRLAAAGRRGEALTATEQSVEICRRLAAENPAAREYDLAASLTNLGNRLSEAGRRAEALTAEQQAVEIYRRLAAENPAAYEPDFAASLSNLGVDLAAAGRRGEALTAAEQSLEIYRRLAAENPAAYEPGLAASLTNLGNTLAEAGRRGEALTAAEQSVEIRRRLAAGNPAAYESDLAASLTNLGNTLAEAGRRGEALTAAKQSVEIYRRWAADNPAAYEPDLAASLPHLSIRLAEEGRLAEALTATEQSVEIYERLAARLPPLLPLLLQVRGLQVVLLDALGREDEAREVRRWIDENQPPPDSPN
ncbi:tetratricopeptide repeat protein [Embleya sp. NPDC020630]|uniref:tetratricopeptide repeat protein n=1 Tax=Embleya sp. NPDC020630 TaxID=3363979 RepID=UPI0037BAC89A